MVNGALSRWSAHPDAPQSLLKKPLADLKADQPAILVRAKRYAPTTRRIAHAKSASSRNSLPSRRFAAGALPINRKLRLGQRCCVFRISRR
jgi:hypothetical protein